MSARTAPTNVELTAVDTSQWAADQKAVALLNLHSAFPERYPFFLESAAQSSGADNSGEGFDILFAFPGEKLTLHGDGVLRSQEQSDSANKCCESLSGDYSNHFLQALDRQFAREQISECSIQVPFIGGWFLFLSYELASQIEPTLRMPIDRNRNIAQAVRIPAAIVRRCADNSLWVVTEPEHSHLAQDIQRDLATYSRESVDDKSQFLTLLANELQEDTPEQYLAAVARSLEHIAAGDVYQANLSRGWRAKIAEHIQPHHLYAQLRRANPAPFAGLALLDDRAIISSTPERLLQVRGRKISTRPIAGTRPRLVDEMDDAAMRRELHSHPKERAEHIMLIDLERNDLGRICRGGSVEVDEYMSVESYAHVHHIVSNVRGELRADVTPGQAIAAVFPGGTITGCPKVRCMQLIADIEGAARGAYTGSMGYLNRDGSMDLNILIRTLELRGQELTFRAGAGIVADSIGVRELAETRVKAQGLINALSMRAHC